MVSREEFQELCEANAEMSRNLRQLNTRFNAFLEATELYIKEAGEAHGEERKAYTEFLGTYREEMEAQAEWRANALATSQRLMELVTLHHVHANSLSAISATLALLLIEAGVELKNITESIERALLALPEDMQERAKPIFSAIVDMIHGTIQRRSVTSG